MLNKYSTWGARQRRVHLQKATNRSTIIAPSAPANLATTEIDPWQQAQYEQQLQISSEISQPPVEEFAPDEVLFAVTKFSFDGSADHHELRFERLDSFLISGTSGQDGWWEAYRLPVGEHAVDFPEANENNVGVDWLALEADHPVRLKAKAKLEEYYKDNWTVLDRADFGFVPATYMNVLAGITCPAAEDEPEAEQLVGDVNVQHETQSARHSIATEDSSSSTSKFRKRPRFHPFVTSGAEDYILADVPAKVEKTASSLVSWISHNFGSVVISGELQAEDQQGRTHRVSSQTEDEPSRCVPSDVHVITSGPSWKAAPWNSMFRNITITNPRHKSSWGGISEWTLFDVSCVIQDSQLSSSTSSGAPATDSSSITVIRRFEHFKILHEYLIRKYSTLLVPDLPEAPYAGRFREKFVRKRMDALGRWIGRVVRHPVMGVSEGTNLFLIAAGHPTEAMEKQLAHLQVG
jgi:hypothetical protein